MLKIWHEHGRVTSIESVLREAFAQFDIYAENHHDFQDFEGKADRKRYYDAKLV